MHHRFRLVMVLLVCRTSLHKPTDVYVHVLSLLLAETETIVVLLSSVFQLLSDSSRRVRRAINLVLDVFCRVMGVLMRWLRASVCVFESVEEFHVTVLSSTRFSCCVVPSTLAGCRATHQVCDVSSLWCGFRMQYSLLGVFFLCAFG